MKIIITGASGLLGRALMQRFREYNPIGCAFSRAGNQWYKLDLTQSEAVTRLIHAEQPDVIIHAAAERSPEACAQDHASALRLNVDATAHLAKEAKAVGAWLLYISSDYVFDGTAPPYSVDDAPNPLSFYGHSKWEGEKVIQSLLSRYGILRVGLLYGEVQTLAESAITALIPLLDEPAARLDHYSRRYPLHTMDAANACWHLVQQAMQDKAFQGVFHGCSQKGLTKYEMLSVMATQLGKSMQPIEPITGPVGVTPGRLTVSWIVQSYMHWVCLHLGHLSRVLYR
jgi:S-adenosylmethionine synthetase